ncbi:MAG: TolC family protein [Vicinamibacterales bacterium]|nr:TolC family protein [Vicinamibacterales bacterium]
MRVLHIAAAAVLAAGPAWAGQPAPLTIDDAVREALGSNVALVAGRASVGPLRERPAQARFLPPPMVEAQIWRWPVTTLNPAKVDMYMFMGQQSLPARGARAAEAAMAEREAELADTGVAVRERDTVEAVTRAYVDLLVTRRARTVFDETLTALRQLSDVSLARYRTTTGGSQDVLKTVLEISRLHQDLIDLDEATRTAEVRLATLLGRDPGSPVGALTEPPPIPAPVDARALAALAEQRAPELQRAAAGTHAAEASLTIAQLARRPEYVVRGGYMLMPGEAGALTASFGVSWPQAPWSRGRLDARERERAAAVEAARAETAEVRQQIHAAVHEAVTAYEAAVKRAALVTTTLIPQARQVVDTSRVGYSAGQVDFLTVIDGQRMQLAAELDAIYAGGGVLIAAAALERAVGIRLSDPAAVAALVAGREQ